MPSSSSFTISPSSQAIFEQIIYNPNYDPEKFAFENEKIVKNLSENNENLVKTSQDNLNENTAENNNAEENVNKVRLEMFKEVFNTVVLRGLNNFGLWWLISVWFTTTTLGYIYHNQFRPLL